MNAETGDWPTLRQVQREKIKWWRGAGDIDVLRCINDRPFCGFAEIHRRVDLPFALREAKRRHLSLN